jgi:hypothetical protein
MLVGAGDRASAQSLAHNLRQWVAPLDLIGDH